MGPVAQPLAGLGGATKSALGSELVELSRVDVALDLLIPLIGTLSARRRVP